ALNTILAREAVVIDFSPGGDYGLTPATGSPVGALIARLVGAVLRCREDGSWARLKVCDRESCRWAYYDGSRNLSRRWCSMAGCGNYVKMRRRGGRTS